MHPQPSCWYDGPGYATSFPSGKIAPSDAYCVPRYWAFGNTKSSWVQGPTWAFQLSIPLITVNDAWALAARARASETMSQFIRIASSGRRGQTDRCLRHAPPPARGHADERDEPRRARRRDEQHVVDLSPA